MKKDNHFQKMRKLLNATSVEELPRSITKNLTDEEMKKLRASKRPYLTYISWVARVEVSRPRKNVKPNEPSHRITIWGEDYLVFEKLSECAKVSMQNLMHQIARHMKERNPKIFCTYSKEQK